MDTNKDDFLLSAVLLVFAFIACMFWIFKFFQNWIAIVLPLFLCMDERWDERTMMIDRDEIEID